MGNNRNNNENEDIEAVAIIIIINTEEVEGYIVDGRMELRGEQVQMVKEDRGWGCFRFFAITWRNRCGAKSARSDGNQDLEQLAEIATLGINGAGGIQKLCKIIGVWRSRGGGIERNTKAEEEWEMGEIENLTAVSQIKHLQASVPKAVGQINHNIQK